MYRSFSGGPSRPVAAPPPVARTGPDPAIEKQIEEAKAFDEWSKNAGTTGKASFERVGGLYFIPEKARRQAQRLFIEFGGPDAPGLGFIPLVVTQQPIEGLRIATADPKGEKHVIKREAEKGVAVLWKATNGKKEMAFALTSSPEVLSGIAATGDWGILAAPQALVGQATVLAAKPAAEGKKPQIETIRYEPSQTWKTVNTVGSYIGFIGGAYHGYKRNESAGMGLGWAIFGGLLWPLAVPLMFAQGFGKPAYKTVAVANRRRRKLHRAIRRMR